MFDLLIIKIAAISTVDKMLIIYFYHFEFAKKSDSLITIGLIMTVYKLLFLCTHTFLLLILLYSGTSQ